MKVKVFRAKLFQQITHQINCFSMEKFLTEVKGDLKGVGVLIALFVEFLTIIVTFLNAFKSIFPESLTWLSSMMGFLFLLLPLATICTVIIKKKKQSEFYIGSIVPKYSSRQRRIAKITLIGCIVSIFCMITLSFIFFNHAQNKIVDKTPIKVILSSFQNNSQADEFSITLRNSLTGEFLKRELTNVKEIKRESYFDIDNAQVQTLAQIFTENHAMKGIFAFGDYWEKTAALDCNLFIYQLPLSIKIPMINRKDILIFKTPDTVKIKDIQGQTEYVSELIIAIIYQRLSKIDESNKTILKLLSEKTLRKSFRVVCYRILAENSACVSNYDNMKKYFYEASLLDPEDKYISRYIEAFNFREDSLEVKDSLSFSLSSSSSFRRDKVLKDTGRQTNTPADSSFLQVQKLAPGTSLNQNLQYQQGKVNYQLDTAKISLKTIPEDIKMTASNYSGSDYKTQMSCLSIEGDLFEDKMSINLNSATQSCIKTITLAFFSDLNMPPFLEVKLNNFDGITLEIPYDFLTRSAYARQIFNKKLSRVFLYGKLEFDDQYNLPDEYIATFIK